MGTGKRGELRGHTFLTPVPLTGEAWGPHRLMTPEMAALEQQPEGATLRMPGTILVHRAEPPSRCPCSHDCPCLHVGN